MRLGTIALLLVWTTPILAADDAPKHKAPPWHLVDIWWDLGPARALESYSLDVTIRDEVPANVRLYIAPIGIAHLSGTPFYGGIQTQTDGYSKADRRLRKIGPGLLMSMWGQRSEEAIRPSVGGLFQSSGHEGDFVSVRRPYAWEPGTYTYRVVRMDKEIVDGKPFTWVGAFVYSHAKDENVFVGALRFPGENLELAGKAASFVEIYGPRIPLEQIPKVTVQFGNLKINGQPPETLAATAVYPAGVPDYADVTAQDRSLIVKVGDPVPDRSKRHVPLFRER